MKNSLVKQSQRIEQFGLEVRRRRLALGFSQEDLADVSGLHRTYISGIERGDRNPTLEILLRLSTALRCSLHELFAELGD